MLSISPMAEQKRFKYDQNTPVESKRALFAMDIIKKSGVDGIFLPNCDMDALKKYPTALENCTTRKVQLFAPFTPRGRKREWSVDWDSVRYIEDEEEEARHIRMWSVGGFRSSTPKKAHVNMLARMLPLEFCEDLSIGVANADATLVIKM